MITSKTVEVKSRRGKKGEKAEVVGTPTILQAGTLPECTQIAGSAERVVEIFNTQWLTNECNRVRALATAQLSDKKARSMAVESIMNDNDAMRRLMACGSPEEHNTVKEQLIAEKVAKLKAEYVAPEATTDDDDGSEADDAATA